MLVLLVLFCALPRPLTPAELDGARPLFCPAVEKPQPLNESAPTAAPAVPAVEPHPWEI